MSTAVAARYSIEEFLELPDAKNYELVDGELKEREMSVNSVWTSGRVYGHLFLFLLRSPIGLLFPDGLPLAIFPDRPRYSPRPDGAYISFQRLGQESVPAGGSLRVAPELVVEVVSTHDRAIDIEGKIRDYLAAGVNLVWVVYPELGRVHIYRADGSASVLAAPAELTGEDILPGFSVPVAELFPAD